MIIYQITLPKKQNTEVFVKFMNEEYLPSVHKGQTRAGQVTGLTLLERENEHEGVDVSNEFYWQVGWAGPYTIEIYVEDPEIERKFKAFGAEVKRLGLYEEVAVWHKESSI